MRRQEFPIVTCISLVGLVLVAVWQLVRAVDFSEGVKAIDVLVARPIKTPQARPLRLPDLQRPPIQSCITVFRPPTVQTRIVAGDDFILKPRLRFRLLRAGEKDADVELNRDGLKVMGLKLGGYFQFQGERYYLIDLKEDQATLRQASNQRRYTASTGELRKHEHM